ncbi:hypothetical protein AKJ43_01180 [candidate division MSBL1 archaeon SCGC-AAA261D19]|uniref:Uncharacterized protein n=1 Tax=candidate division MSBL1 archaeon SCGC-AAA261D19 TaxID=1698273 RepID=A0A133V860_9EURY|nr:hypothetical protein AKJ43_01180 [candidate division MSBL1 archaeon SCGC-AAA261D19]
MNSNPLTEIKKIKLHPLQRPFLKKLENETGLLYKRKVLLLHCRGKKTVNTDLWGVSLMHGQQRLRDKNLIRLQEGMAA